MENTMPKIVTVEELAQMVARLYEASQKEFDEFRSEMREFRVETNANFAELRKSDAKQSEDIKNLAYRVKQLENANA